MARAKPKGPFLGELPGSVCSSASQDIRRKKKAWLSGLKMAFIKKQAEDVTKAEEVCCKVQISIRTTSDSAASKIG